MTLTRRWSTFTRLHRRIENHVERELHRCLGVGVREFHALTALKEGASDAAGHLHFDELADGMGLSRPATGRLVTRLRDRGLITTDASPCDRRDVDVRLTPVAQDVLRLGAPLLERAVQEAVRGLACEDTDPDLLRYLRGPA